MIISREQIRSAWDGLSSHRLRSGLTALGVIFGVAAVVAMASIGEGARRESLRQIERMGVGNILIEEDRAKEGEEHDKALEKNPEGLTIADAQALRDILPDVVDVVPLRSGDPMVSAGGEPVKMHVVATTPGYFDLYDLRTMSGRRLVLTDEADYRRVCVLGAGARRKLFPLTPPLGRQVQMNTVDRKHIFTVVGVIAARSAGVSNIKGLELRDENLDIYIPLETARKRVHPPSGESELTEIVVKIRDTEQIGATAALIGRILDRRHRGVKDFKVIVPEELLRQQQATQRIFNIVMGTIASISLLVGGIGIMNIMLASVLERTREIGIRRAVGATQADITRQFLSEAVLLSLSGGLVGVALGVGLARVISLYAGWETAVSFWAVLVAVTVAAGVGVIFGWLPARRAARLDPILALRYE